MTGQDQSGPTALPTSNLSTSLTLSLKGALEWRLMSADLRVTEIPLEINAAVTNSGAAGIVRGLVEASNAAIPKTYEVTPAASLV